MELENTNNKPDETSYCCGGLATKNKIKYRTVRSAAALDTLAGFIPVVSTTWSLADYRGMLAVRLNCSIIFYVCAE
jgi:hypothetical protein